MVDQNSPRFGRSGGSKFGFEVVSSGLKSAFASSNWTTAVADRVRPHAPRGSYTPALARAVKPKGWKTRVLTLSLAPSRSPSLSRSRTTLKRRPPCHAAAEPSPAKSTTHTTPPSNSPHPQLRRVALYRTDPLTSPFEHR